MNGNAFNGLESRIEAALDAGARNQRGTGAFRVGWSLGYNDAAQDVRAIFDTTRANEHLFTAAYKATGLDFPAAWKITQRVAPEYHHNKCSFNVTNGGMLCDCDVLYKSPEYVAASDT